MVDDGKDVGDYGQYQQTHFKALTLQQSGKAGSRMRFFLEK